MQYMPYMEDHFYAAMGLRLNGLRDFTGWIKQGSYYHGLVARQGHLYKCPHLAGVVLPRWPQVTPSESHQVSQKKVETSATSSSVPSTGAWEAQETHSNGVPAPMETGGAGDGQSWADQVKASADDKFQRDRPMKHRRSHLPRTTMAVVRMPPFRRLLLTSSAMSFCEALLANASRMPPFRRPLLTSSAMSFCEALLVNASRMPPFRRPLLTSSVMSFCEALMPPGCLQSRDENHCSGTWKKTVPDGRG